MIAVYATALSMFLAIALVPLLVRVARPMGLLDRPGPRKIHSNAIPRVGGIAIAVGAIVSVMVWLPFRPEILAYAVGSMVIFLFGLLDDLFDLDFRLKLVGQTLGTVAFIMLADVYLTRMPFMFDGQIPSWLGLPFTVFAIVGVTNAINLSDGMDGLAGGTSLLAACALGYLAFLGGDNQIALLALAVIGATLGFLRYNTFPARVFMGDAGSQFLGFSVAALALLIIERSNTAISPLAPLLLLALPIIDTLKVIVLRLRAGVSPFAPDRRHLHHRLLDVGLSQHQAVVLIYGLQVLLIGLTWILIYERDYILLAVFAGFALLLQLLIGRWQHRHKQGGKLLMALRNVEPIIKYIRENHVLARIGARGVVFGVSLLFLTLAFTVEHINQDVGLLSFAMLVLLALALWPKSPLPQRGISRLASFVCAVMLVYLASSSGLEFDFAPALLMAYLLALVVFIALWMRFGSSPGFQLNTLDVLVIVFVAVVPNLQLIQQTGLGPVMLKSLLLFYACEMIVSQRPKYSQHFQFAVMGTLAILATRSVFAY